MRPHKGQRRRGLWEFVHKTSGALIVLGTPAVIIFGTVQLNKLADAAHQSDIPRFAYIGVAGLTVLVFAALECRLRRRRAAEEDFRFGESGRVTSSEMGGYRPFPEAHSGDRV